MGEGEGEGRSGMSKNTGVWRNVFGEGGRAEDSTRVGSKKKKPRLGASCLASQKVKPS